MLALYKNYKIDFDMFGYDVAEFLDYAQESSYEEEDVDDSEEEDDAEEVEADEEEDEEEEEEEDEEEADAADYQEQRWCLLFISIWSSGIVPPILRYLKT